MFQKKLDYVFKIYQLVQDQYYSEHDYKNLCNQLRN